MGGPRACLQACLTCPLSRLWARVWTAGGLHQLWCGGNTDTGWGSLTRGCTGTRREPVSPGSLQVRDYTWPGALGSRGPAWSWLPVSSHPVPLSTASPCPSPPFIPQTSPAAAGLGCGGCRLECFVLWVWGQTSVFQEALCDLSFQLC